MYSKAGLMLRSSWQTQIGLRVFGFCVCVCCACAYAHMCAHTCFWFVLRERKNIKLVGGIWGGLEGKEYDHNILHEKYFKQSAHHS